MSTSGNTWPPLISEKSTDSSGARQLYGTETLASCLIDMSDGDAFFHPEEQGLSGFAANGSRYVAGVATLDLASWFTEGPGVGRGGAPGFPERSMVLVTDVGVSILDMREHPYNLWMLFQRCDEFGYVGNPFSDARGYTPAAVNYAQGKLIMQMSADAGSVEDLDLFLTFDFVQDSIYANFQKPSQVLEGYELQPIFFFGSQSNHPVMPVLNNPTVHGLWLVEPKLPTGVSLNINTGAISGNPTLPGTGEWPGWERTTHVVSLRSGGRTESVNVTFAAYDPDGGVMPTLNSGYLQAAVLIAGSDPAWSFGFEANHLDDWYDTLGDLGYPVAQVLTGDGYVALAPVAFTNPLNPGGASALVDNKTDTLTGGALLLCMHGAEWDGYGSGALQGHRVFTATIGN